ncbi:hypothetical protein BGZ76_000747, partial [Entomortierella beljakovae]
MENQDHISWLLAKSETEHVSMKSFAPRFNYMTRDIAEKDFQNLINYTKIDKARRYQLQNAFDNFKSNRPEIFWEKRSATAQASIIAMKSAGDTME